MPIPEPECPAAPPPQPQEVDEKLKAWAKATWCSLVRMTNTTTYLPADKIDGAGRPVSPTSPTNIGALMWSMLAARELAIITDLRARALLDATLDSRVTVADNTSGRFLRHTFATPGDYPSVAASGGKVFVTWSVTVNGLGNARVAERSRGSWTDVTLGRSTDDHEFAWEVTAFRGKATVHLRGARGSVDVQLARTQQ